MKIKDGGPAFPNEGFNGWGSPHSGMTLRDYFAAKAMEKIDGWHMVDYGGDTKETVDRRVSEEQAKWCYQVADAMLKAREE